MTTRLLVVNRSYQTVDRIKVALALGVIGDIALMSANGQPPLSSVEAIMDFARRKGMGRHDIVFMRAADVSEKVGVAYSKERLGKDLPLLIWDDPESSGFAPDTAA